MQDATALVYAVLAADVTLNQLMGHTPTVVGGEQNSTAEGIYNEPTAPDLTEFPRITMFEVVNDDAVPADNMSLCSDAVIRIDLWTASNEDIFPLVKQIKKALYAAFAESDLSINSTMVEMEDDTKAKTYHKPMDFNLLIEQEV